MEIKVENSGEFAYLMEEFANIIKTSEKNCIYKIKIVSLRRFSIKFVKLCYKSINSDN